MEIKQISKKRKLAKKNRLKECAINLSKKKKKMNKVVSIRMSEDAIYMLNILSNINSSTNGKEFERLIRKEYSKIENNIERMLNDFDNLSEKVIEI